jgi:hypothetical protein
MTAKLKQRADRCKAVVFYDVVNMASGHLFAFGLLAHELAFGDISKHI